jgi:hypothetical protein
VDIFYNTYPISGSPEGLILANKNALFFTRGDFSRINYTGTGSWVDVTYKARRTPSQYEFSQSIDTTPITYVKTTDGSTTGWTFLAAGSLFITS